jgi:FtsZ-binding cell division protein ZapB|tara:strand:+ start:166 stop:489 length:324 start_codon:yes stop_codon:yes gene_type:complete
MKNFEKKETNLNQLIDKLSKLNISYTQFNFDNLSIQKERDIIQHKKEELEKKNIQILREHKFLRDRVTKLEQQLKDKRDMEKKFNKDIDDLNQETLSLVEEIEKWQM